jgi:hypothetical protein
MQRQYHEKDRGSRRRPGISLVDVQGSPMWLLCAQL